jgi:hypothetical protein
MRSRRTLTYILVVLGCVTLAGCGGLGTEQSARSYSYTVTPAPVPTDTPTEETLLDGLDRTGITHVLDLADEHETALRHENFTFYRSSTLYTADGSRYAGTSETLDVSTTHRTVRSRRTYDGATRATSPENTTLAEQWSNVSGSHYRFTTDSGEQFYRHIGYPPTAFDYSRQYHTFLYQAETKQVAVRDETIVVTGTLADVRVPHALPAVDVETAAFTLRLTPDGRIISTDVRYTGRLQSTNQSVVGRDFVWFFRVGMTSVTPPEWVNATPSDGDMYYPSNWSALRE